MIPKIKPRAAALALGGFLFFSQGSWGAERTLIDRAHIVVNGKMVTKREIENSRNLQERDIRARLKGEVLEVKLKELDKLIDDQVIETLLLEARAERLGIQASDEEIEERVHSIIQRDPRITSVYTDRALKE